MVCDDVNVIIALLRFACDASLDYAWRKKHNGVVKQAGREEGNSHGIQD